MNYLLRSRFLGFACLAAATSVLVSAATTSWPTWRGPTGSGVSPGATPPLTWGDNKNVKWKAKIPGLGFSTPIVWQDRIFLLSAVPVGGTPGFDKAHEFTVFALDRATGKTIWSQVARRETPHEGHHPTNSFASASPITDGQKLWVPFGSRGFYCYDLQGNLLWQKDLGDMKTRMAFGEGSSPAIAGDHLIITWDQEEGSFIVALNKNTGAEVWRKPREERSSWSTPLIVEVNGRQQAIVAASRATRAYDAATGEIVWQARGLTGNVIPHPIVGHGMVYVMSGFQGNSIQAIKLSSKGDVSDSDNIVWHVRRSASYAPSALLSGDRLYMAKSNDAYLSCLNALTGEVHYQDQPLPGVRGIYASPLAANGLIYVVGREGTVMVLKDAAKFEVVATNTLNDRIDASPVALDKELFLRGHEYLYCIAEG
jgi:outer membrane protein assembly factor BamB